MAFTSWLRDLSTLPTSTWSRDGGISPTLYSPNPTARILLNLSMPKVSSPITSTIWSKTSMRIFQTWEYSLARLNWPLALKFSIISSILPGIPMQHRKSYRALQISPEVFLPFVFLRNSSRGPDTAYLTSLISFSISPWLRNSLSSGRTPGTMSQSSSLVH